MPNKLCKVPLWEVSARLVEVAQGRSPAETVIRDAKLINVCTGEILEHIDVAIAMGRIALVGDASHCIGEKTKVLDAGGSYISPGFLDGHIHVESSMMSVGEYARAVVPRGTVGIFMDPHEICNVLGVEGVKCMIEDSLRSPLKTMVTAPSCVPGVPGFEDTGAEIGPDDIREMMTWDSVVGLGEMMNMPGVLGGDKQVFDELAETLKAGKVITGHYSMQDTGKGLNAYIASGACCCHESTRAEDALAKMRLGMYAMLREGSAWHDLSEVAKALTGNKIDSRFAVLVSDDAHPETLVNRGHLDYILSRAVEEGIDPITAIQMVTINCAQCFRVERDLGSITPGKCADIVFIESLETMKVTRVMIDGEVVAENGVMLAPVRPYEYPSWARNTMNLGIEITAQSFELPCSGKDHVLARAIEIVPAKVGNYERIVRLPVRGGLVESDVSQDVLKAVVFERHSGTGKKGVGFVKGFGIKKGAMASTVAHDAHNLLVIGTNDEDMALAANTLISCGGGMCVASGGKVLGLVELPIAGIMSDRAAAELAESVAALDRAWKEIGCNIVSPFMTMALIPLACIPELRLTNRGLVDCRTFEFTNLFLK
ncbi:MAG: adenine deaminase [Oscillospiraceae bacterium]|jgi:adenine deaminase